MKGEGISTANQSMPWQDISAKAARMDVFSDTMPMHDIYESHALEPEVLNEAFKVADNQVGYMAFIKGGFAGRCFHFRPSVPRENGKTTSWLLPGLSGPWSHLRES